MPSKIWRRLCAVHEKSAVLFLKASGAGTARFALRPYAIRPAENKRPGLAAGHRCYLSSFICAKHSLQ